MGILSLNDLNKKSLDRNDLALFLSKASIYRSSYNKQINGKWISINGYLTDEILLNSINNREKSDVAYFSCYKTNFFALDIDNHNGETNLAQAFKCAANILGSPSLISKSPRGLHLYYFLKERFDADLLTLGLKKKFEKCPYSYEFKPTSDSALRTINFNNLLDTETLEQLNGTFEEVISKSAVYSVSELFYDVDFKNMKFIRGTTTNKWPVIEKGQTNEALNYFIPLWKGQGFDVNRCTAMFISKLSPNYYGDCTDYNHVKRRVSSFFKRDIAFHYEKIPNNLIEQKYEKQIQIATDVYLKRSKTNDHNKNLFVQKLKKYMILILSEKDKMNEVYNNPKSRSYYSSIYPFFDYEVGQGNTPLSSELLKTESSSYQKVLRFLFSIGMLKRKNGASYDSFRGSCQYYFIDPNFIDQYSEFYYHKYYDKNSIRQLLTYSLTVVYSAVHFVTNLISSTVPRTSLLEEISYNMFSHQNEEVTINNKLLFTG